MLRMLRIPKVPNVLKGSGSKKVRAMPSYIFQFER
jgi:hypothetical protein